MHPKFGIRFSAERLARIENSPNYKNGMFQNLSPSKPKLIKPNKGKIRGFIDFLNRDKTGLMPSGRVEIKKEDLYKINKDSNLVVWFGHSSLLVQVDGNRVLVDPVLFNAAPLGFINKSFDGVNFLKEQVILPIISLNLTGQVPQHSET